MIRTTYSLEGKEIAVTFYDHTQSHEEPLLCRIWGRCHKDHPEYLTVDVFIPLETNEPRSVDNNTECFTIIRSTIISIHSIERRPLESNA
jgi:hypothetical protein